MRYRQQNVRFLPKLRSPIKLVLHQMCHFPQLAYGLLQISLVEIGKCPVKRGLSILTINVFNHLGKEFDRLDVVSRL